MMFRNIAGLKELLLENAPLENVLYCFAKIYWMKSFLRNVVVMILLI